MYVSELPNEVRRISEEVKRITIYINDDKHVGMHTYVCMYMQVNKWKKVEIKAP